MKREPDFFLDEPLLDESDNSTETRTLVVQMSSKMSYPDIQLETSKNV